MERADDNGALRTCPKQHLGVNFAIWANEGAWFWFLINPGGEGAMIGASVNEAQAISDACLSIEEQLTVA
jgi:hypothetical protein